MLASKWACGPHNLHIPWVSSVIFKCFANIRITDQIAFLCFAFMPRGGIYTCVFLCRSGFRRWAWPRLLSPSLFMFWKSFARLQYLLRVTFYSVGRFQTRFHGGYHSPFHFLSVSLRLVSLRTSLSVVMACVAFTLVFLGVCRLPVSHFWRESLSLVSWCLSYFALHFVFIACVAYKLFSWRVSPSGCVYGVCRLPVSHFWRVPLSL